MILELQHLAFVGSRRDRRASHLGIHKLLNGGRGLKRMTVVHEPDGGCCRVEPWSTTFIRLIEALNAVGRPAVGVAIGSVNDDRVFEERRQPV